MSERGHAVVQAIRYRIWHDANYRRWLEIDRSLGYVSFRWGALYLSFDRGGPFVAWWS